MELSDSDEEIVDLNAENDKSKEEEKKDKPKSKLSSSKISKWIKPSLESLSQMAKSIPEDTENVDPNNTDQNYANFEMDNDEDNDDNVEDNQDKLSDYNNYNNDKDNNNNEYKDNNNKSTDDTNTNTNSNSAKNNHNYIFTWDEGGNSVKLIGSFSNWTKYYDMEKDEKDQIFKFSLPLENGKYQYKFIVDGVWKCSKKQNTEDDGKGNINNILDLTNIKPKEEIKNNNISKKNSKIENKKKIKEKKKKEKKKSDMNIKKEKKKPLKKNVFGNDYPDPLKLTEPNHDDDIGKVFNINNESKQKKIGNQKFNKFEINNSYSSNKSYLNISGHRHTKLNHIIFQKKIKNKFNIKIGMSYRYRGKATTFIYYNCLTEKNI